MAIIGSGSENAWQRECLIEVSDGTTHLALHGLTETVDIDIGERDLDVINLVNLGQIPKHGHHGLTTVTFEGYCKEAGTPATGAQTGLGFWDIFAQKPAMDTAEPQTNSVTVDATRFRVAIMWTDETGETLASAAVANSQSAKRFVLSDCYCTAHKDAFTDGILKTTLTFKGSAFNAAAAARMKIESIDGAGSGTFGALQTYVPGSTPW
jgi:hypothetical protein